MSSQITVHQIQAVEDLRAALIRYGSEAQEALTALEMQISRVRNQFMDQRRYWENALQVRKIALRQAVDAFNLCRSRVYQDPNTGAVYIPPCTEEQSRIQTAQAKVQEAESALKNVEQWIGKIEEGISQYQRQARQFASQMSNELPKATAMLNSFALKLHEAHQQTLGAGSLAAAIGSIAVAGALSTSNQPDPNVFSGGAGMETLGNPEIERNPENFEGGFRRIRGPEGG